MGTISEQLNALKQELQNAKDSINSKYNTMDMPSIDKLQIKELSTRINNIPVLNTKDATATENDITENLIAYVKEKKVVGKLLDYRSKNITVDLKLNNSSISMILPGEAIYNKASDITIDFDKIIDLIKLTPDIIKKGEIVLGITGTYEDTTGGSTETPDIEIDEDDPSKSYYNYDATSWMFHMNYKWGLWEILLGTKNPNDYSNAIYHTAYTRMYNAYHLNGQNMDGYFVQYNQNEKTYHNHYYEIDGIKYLTCYVGDLKLTPDECEYIYKCLRYDSPELLMKFTSYRYSYNSEGYVTYMFFDNFDEATRQQYKNACFETFRAICPVIYANYGIDTSIPYQSYSASVNENHYTTEQKVKIAKVIHDYLVLHNNYHESSVENLDQTMYPALSRGIETPVCASYAHAFQWCCQKFGIWCYVVNGSTDSEGNARHLWNMINYTDYGSPSVTDSWKPSIWSEVDVTWDDPTNAGESYCTWEFFNITTSYIQSSRGGNRRRSYREVTNYGNEAYYGFIVDECTCASYTYNGNTQYGGM